MEDSPIFLVGSVLFIVLFGRVDTTLKQAQCTASPPCTLVCVCVCACVTCACVMCVRVVCVV